MQTQEVSLGILTRNQLGAEGGQLPERPGTHSHPFSPQPSTGADPRAGTAETRAPLCLLGTSQRPPLCWAEGHQTSGPAWLDPLRAGSSSM